MDARGGTVFTCPGCRSKSRVFCRQWPPRFIVCPGCSAPFRLSGYREATHKYTYSRIKKKD